MKEASNECNLSSPIFNISSLNSKVTRYDPNTVPIMQHWSKWPFHTEEWRKINPTPPPLFSFCLYYSLCAELVWLHVPPESTRVWCVCMYLWAKCCFSNQLTPAQKVISGCPYIQVPFCCSHLCVCLFLTLCETSSPTDPPHHHLTLSAARYPAMLNPRSTDRWQKPGQTPLPISRGVRLGAIIKANSSPTRSREQEKKRDEKSEIGTMPKHIFAEGSVLIWCTAWHSPFSVWLVTADVLSPLSTRHETSSVYF